MPTYEYLCGACGHKFEEFQSITAKPIRKCPECGKSKVDRLLGTGAGMIFKGSGFYITDYRSEGYKAAAKAESGSAGGNGGGSGGEASGGGASSGAGSGGGSTSSTGGGSGAAGGSSSGGGSGTGASSKPAKSAKK